MLFCQNCGTQLEDGAKFCPNCGAAQQNAAAGPEPAFAAAAAAPADAVQQAPAGMESTEGAPVPPAPEPVAPQGAPQQAAYQQPMAPQGGYQQPAPQQAAYQQPMQGYAPAAPQMKKGMAVLSYFGLFVLIPIFAAKNDPFARYHANQGLVLCILSLICSFVSNLLTDALLEVNTVVALVVSILFSIISIVLFVFAIIGIVHAAKGQTKPLPLIGKITLLK